MSIKGPNPEDVRKLHAEINQIVNQRFLLTTLALTVSGVMMAWMVPKGGDSIPPLGAFPFLVSMILSIVLFWMFFLNQRLRNTLRTYSTYLIVTKASDWELDWSRFRDGGRTSYIVPQTVMFLVLDAVGVALPIWIKNSAGEGLLFDWSMSSALLAGFLAMTAIGLMGFGGLWSNETKVAQRWIQLQNKSGS